VTPRFNGADVLGWKEIKPNKSPTEDMRGVYAIVFFPIDGASSLTRVYFGSSVRIQQRLYDHHVAFKRSNSHNTQMNQLVASGQYHIKFYLVELSDDELETERQWIQKYPKSNVINVWNLNSVDDIYPFLTKAVKHLRMRETTGYVVNETTGCWECIALDSEGYGETNVQIAGKKKHFKNHRLSYWLKYGTYPSLVRHMCHNRRCMNPDHLKPGNHQDNQQDKRERLKGMVSVIHQEK
jgi:hypothetical protein